MNPTAPAAARALPEVRVEFAHQPQKRLASIDAYRGLVMFLMMAEILAIGKVAAALPENAFWKFLHWQQSHVEWVGCVLHDLIQPSFSFLVGVALPFSIAARMARGQTLGVMLGHTVWRSILLIVLGIFLRSVGKAQTNFTFEDTLTQIGLGYSFLFLIGLRGLRTQWMAFALICFGYWLLFALYPLPGPDFNWAAAGVKPDWSHHLQGFAAHWNKNTNPAWAFDTWFLNHFPREKPFLYNGGGYATLSFIPTLATMILGSIAGRWLRDSPGARATLKRLVIAGVIGWAAGMALHLSGICPIVKRIWTPSWVLFSGGWCFLLLAVFYLIIEVRNSRRWAFPLLVVGMNSIAAYIIAHLWDGFVLSSLRTHLGEGFFRAFGPYGPFVRGALALLILWLFLLWMYRRRLFLKI